MLSTVVLSNENQTCRGWEAHTSTGGGGCHQVRVRIHGMIARIEILPEEFPKLIADETETGLPKLSKSMDLPMLQWI